MVEFISYDGKYPCLCSGTLIIKIDGKIYHLKNVLVSGGAVIGGPPEWDFEVITGNWTVALCDYLELEKYKCEIEQVVNEHVQQGCCGGCV